MNQESKVHSLFLSIVISNQIEWLHDIFNLTKDHAFK